MGTEINANQAMEQELKSWWRRRRRQQCGPIFGQHQPRYRHQEIYKVTTEGEAPRYIICESADRARGLIDSVRRPALRTILGTLWRRDGDEMMRLVKQEKDEGDRADVQTVNRASLTPASLAVLLAVEAFRNRGLSGRHRRKWRQLYAHAKRHAASDAYARRGLKRLRHEIAAHRRGAWGAPTPLAIVTQHASEEAAREYAARA